MTVAELRALLAQYPDDAEVRTEQEWGSAPTEGVCLGERVVVIY
ncbi:hypothetical protein C1Y40_04133 [Mycobacterium talmoniae]|uniref:Uncharacterized protein n=1 Tax=Mycobacterium talmoniae TaxID=1858794 RepID=A0A2S8BGE0_9MYCO|nr:hypothetical protein C1Y40_04133 [Mycobacterium talmoniae]